MTTRLQFWLFAAIKLVGMIAELGNGSTKRRPVKHLPTTDTCQSSCSLQKEPLRLIALIAKTLFGRSKPGISPYAWLIAVCLARIAMTLFGRSMPGLSPYA